MATRWIVLLVVLAIARTADAHDVQFEVSRAETRLLYKKLDGGEGLTGKAKLRLRLVGEKAWLLDEEVALEAELDAGGPKAFKLKLSRDVKFDAKSDVECHIMLPTTNGAWMGAVAITKAAVINAKKKTLGVRCSASAITLSRMATADFEWPAATQPVSVSFGFAISVSGANAALGKAKDTAGKDGQATATLEIFDATTKAFLHERSFKVKMNALSDYVTNEDGGEAAWSVVPGTAVLYRVSIPTSKGFALVAEGAGTARIMASYHAQPSLVIEAKLAYVNAAKKLPKLGQWSKP